MRSYEPKVLARKYLALGRLLLRRIYGMVAETGRPENGSPETGAAEPEAESCALDHVA